MNTLDKDIDDQVSYISYRDEDDKIQLWRVSPVTQIAEFIPTPKEPSEYFTRCSKAATRMDIKYITEYLIPLEYCEFEREGDQLKFKHYNDDPPGTIMKTKVCDKCEKSFILNVDKTTCQTCTRMGEVD